MERASGGGGPAPRVSTANGRAEAGLPLSRGGRGSELLWCGASGGRRLGGPGAAAGLGAQPSGCRGGASRTRPGPGRRGFEAGPGAGRPRRPGGAARR
ncbi:hypothetical protein VULLAG_LOCUS10360 [Vulpes lagopus]